MKKHTKELAGIFLILNKVHDMIKEIEREWERDPPASRDERYDAVSSSASSVADACTQLSYVIDAETLSKEIQKADKR